MDSCTDLLEGGGGSAVEGIGDEGTRCGVTADDDLCMVVVGEDDCGDVDCCITDNDDDNSMGVAVTAADDDEVDSALSTAANGYTPPAPIPNTNRHVAKR
jgi:hypothetical protein